LSMASLGQEIKRERELRGISLKEIADTTRISLKFLQALEEDHLEVIPGPFFIRAILRSYAKSVGLDENQWLNKYQEMLLFNEYQTDKQPKKRLNPPLVLTKKRLKAILVFLIIIVISALCYFLFVSSPDKRASSSPKPTAPALTSSVPPQPAPTPSEQPPAEEVKGLHLEMSFLEDTWLQIYADGTMVWDGIKRRGEVLQVRAQNQLALNLGNAGGIDWTLNGKKAKRFGPKGAVRKDIKITLDNFREYFLPEKGNAD